MIDVAVTELNGTTPGTPRDPYRELHTAVRAPTRRGCGRACGALAALPVRFPAPIGIARGGVRVVYK